MKNTMEVRAAVDRVDTTAALPTVSLGHQLTQGANLCLVLDLLTELDFASSPTEVSTSQSTGASSDSASSNCPGRVGLNVGPEVSQNSLPEESRDTVSGDLVSSVLILGLTTTVGRESWAKNGLKPETLGES